MQMHLLSRDNRPVVAAVVVTALASLWRFRAGSVFGLDRNAMLRNKEQILSAAES